MQLDHTTDDLDLFVIYDHPTDYPKHFVVRRQRIKSGQILMLECELAETLEEARHLVPRGLTRLNRSYGDDEKIMEVWI